MGFFDKIAEGIKKTRDSMMSKVNSLINSFTKIDEDFFEELEETLIMCDIGVQTSVDICAELRKKVKEKGITDPMLIKDELKAIITEMLGEDKKLDLSTKPSVVLVIGVNGAGKSTTIKMLSCLINPTSGDAVLNGYSIVNDSEDVKRIINVSPQETAVAPNLTVRENLELIAEIYGFEKEYDR